MTLPSNGSIAAVVFDIGWLLLQVPANRIGHRQLSLGQLLDELAA